MVQYAQFCCVNHNYVKKIFLYEKVCSITIFLGFILIESISLVPIYCKRDNFICISLYANENDKGEFPIRSICFESKLTEGGKNTVLNFRSATN